MALFSHPRCWCATFRLDVPIGSVVVEQDRVQWPASVMGVTDCKYRHRRLGSNLFQVLPDTSRCLIRRRARDDSPRRGAPRRQPSPPTWPGPSWGPLPSPTDRRSASLVPTPPAVSGAGSATGGLASQGAARETPLRSVEGGEWHRDCRRLAAAGGRDERLGGSAACEGQSDRGGGGRPWRGDAAGGRPLLLVSRLSPQPAVAPSHLPFLAVLPVIVRDCPRRLPPPPQHPVGYHRCRCRCRRSLPLLP